jgi:DNA polymerase I
MYERWSRFLQRNLMEATRKRVNHTEICCRSYIRAPEGRVFVIADYSQIELRIAAKISGDTEMLFAYTEGRDLHTLTAQSLTGRHDVNKDDRKLAKAVNFGLLYGMGTKGLQAYALRSYGVEMSLEEATLYRTRFFETYPGLKGWHDNERRAWQRGETETRTLTGRRRMNIEKLTDRLRVRFKTLSEGWRRKPSAYGFR